MLGTSEGTFCPLSKLWCKSPQTEFFGPEHERFLYKVELRLRDDVVPALADAAHVRGDARSGQRRPKQHFGQIPSDLSTEHGRGHGVQDCRWPTPQRVLTANSSKGFTLFAIPLSLAEAALPGQDVVNKQFIKAGAVRRAVEAAIKTHRAEIRKQLSLLQNPPRLVILSR